MKRLFLVFVLLVVIKCSNVDNIPSANSNVTSKYMGIINGDSLLLVWEDPCKASDSVSNYELYYSVDNKSDWKLLVDNIKKSSAPSAVVYRNKILSTDSVFVFGVKSVNTHGAKSGLHSSDDGTSYNGTWTVLWK